MATYSFLNIVAAISGPGGIVPLGEGAGPAEEGITVEMAEEKNTMTVAADGSVMHSLHAGNAGTVTVRLLKTSPVNAMLSLMYNLQRTSAALHGNNTVTIADPQRGDVCTCHDVAFARQPNLAYAKDGGFNEWVFHAGRITELLGAGLPDVNVGA